MEPQDPQPPALGEKTPDLSLPDSEGSVQTLATLCAERPQVLLFYRGHW